MLKKLRGRWRLFHGYCPECNSDAPNIDTCHVCLGGTFNNFPPPPWIKRLWWDRFVAKLEKTYG